MIMHKLAYTAAVLVAVLVGVLLSASSGTAAPLPAVTNYQVVTATAVVVNQKNVSVTATCPTGKRVLGGGGIQSIGVDPVNPYLWAMENSGPVNMETGWRVDWDGPQLGPPAFTFTATALCANTT